MRNILFDLDGTLTDAREGITKCIQHSLGSLGEHVPDAHSLEKYIGPPLVETYRVLLAEPTEERVARALAAYRERFTKVGMYENQVYPGITDTLSTLARSGSTLFVATSKPGVYAARIAEHFGIGGYFRGIYGPELDGTRDNKAELIAHLLATEGVPADAAVMVGDRSHDVAGAVANGVRTVGVTWGFGSRSELVAAGADRVVDSPQELLRVLNGLNPSPSELTAKS